MESSRQNLDQLDEIDVTPPSPPPPSPGVPNKKLPADILFELLAETGAVSTMKLKSKLREHGHSEVDSIVDNLSESNEKWQKIDRSFFTIEKARALEEAEVEESYGSDSDSDENESEDILDKEEVDEIPLREKKSRREKEKRLCRSYILPFLSSLYYSEFVDETTDVAFCVQDLRPSTQFRNVDLIAVNWRNNDVAELVTVEAKLEFNAQVVQQAANYSRFSHRVWIAVVVEAGIEVEEIVQSLRETDSLLFEYVLSLGLGIIACQKAKGGLIQLLSSSMASETRT